MPSVLIRNTNRNTVTESKCAKGNNEYQGERNHGSNASDASDDDDSDEESVLGPGLDDSLADDIIALRDYSFISISNDGETLAMHALIQLATRRWLTESNQSEQWEGHVLQNLNAQLPNGEYKNWETCQLFFPRVIRAAHGSRKARGCYRSGH